MINNDIIISKDVSLLDALSVMDTVNRKLLIVCDHGKFLGVISVGDVQRALLKKQDLTLPVVQFIREDVDYSSVNEDRDFVKKRMREYRIEAMPIVDECGNLCDIIEWEQLFVNTTEPKDDKIDIPVVIMAGGKGTRLLPLTNVIPKPLIPISDKTIIEEIMTQFQNVGCHKFYISINYMMELIKDFFSKHDSWEIEYIQENKPLGTGGSLYLLKNKIHSTFFVTNCDTLVDINYADLLSYHKKNHNLVTVISAIKAVHIPYGILETGVDGVIKSVKEKPDYVFQINSGFYVLEAEVLNYIEDDRFLNLTDLITRLIDQGEKVGAFPVSEASWFDMGNWDEYLKLVNKYMENA